MNKPASASAGNAGDGFWDLYARVYDNVYQLMPYRKLLWDTLQSLELEAGMRVLDAGCGTGNLEHFMAQKDLPAVSIDAVDFSPGMLEMAAEKCRGLDFVSFQQLDLSAALPFGDATFDRIVSVNVLYALPNPDATLRELLRVLKPSGTLVITSPSPDFRVSALVVDHFRRVKNIWGVRRRAQTIARSMWLLVAGGMAQWFLNSFVINRREAEGQYRSLDAQGMRDLLGRRGQEGLRDFDVTLALADQNVFARGVKWAVS